MEPITILAAGALGYLLRGKTGPVDAITPLDAETWAIGVCELQEASEVSNSTLTPRFLAQQIGASLRPDIDWPPKPLATKSHKTAWAQILRWTQDLVNDAAAAGFVSPCAYLLEEVFPLIPDDDETVEGTFAPPSDLPPVAAPGTPVQPTPADLLPIVTDEPTPGRWYQIGTAPVLEGSGLLAHAGMAYKVGPGPTRLKAAQLVNEAPQNRAGAEYADCGVAVQCTGGGAPYVDGEVLSFSVPQLIYFPPAPKGGF